MPEGYDESFWQDLADQLPRRQNYAPIAIFSGMLILFTLVAVGLFIWAREANKAKDREVVVTERKQRVQRQPSDKPRSDSQTKSENEGNEKLGNAGKGFFIALVSSCAAQVILGLLVAVAWVFMLIWIVRDTRNRSVDNGVIWMIVVAFTGFLGILVYLASRPQGMLVICANCRNKRLEYVKVCPHCGIEAAPTSNLDLKGREAF